MDILWQIITWVLTICTLVSTLKLSLKSIIDFPSNKAIDFISSEYWCFFLILFIPMLIGEYARGEASPLPWVTYSKAYYRHGIWDGILAMLMVITVDMWLFWTTGQVYINSLKKKRQDSITSDMDNALSDFNDENFILKVRFARIINVLAGLVLVTQGNPFHKLMGILF